MLNGFWFTSDVSVHSTHVWRVYVQSFDCVCWPYLNSKGLSRTENEKKNVHEKHFFGGSHRYIGLWQHFFIALSQAAASVESSRKKRRKRRNSTEMTRASNIWVRIEWNEKWRATKIFFGCTIFWTGIKWNDIFQNVYLISPRVDGNKIKTKCVIFCDR